MYYTDIFVRLTFLCVYVSGCKISKIRLMNPEPCKHAYFTLLQELISNKSLIFTI